MFGICGHLSQALRLDEVEGAAMDRVGPSSTEANSGPAAAVPGDYFGSRAYTEPGATVPGGTPTLEPGGATVPGGSIVPGGYALAAAGCT